jgi:hypothetical protein
MLRHWPIEQRFVPLWAMPLVALVAAILGFCVSVDEWRVPAILMVAAGVLLCAVLATDTFLAIVLVFAVVLQPPVANIGGIPELEFAELLVPILLLVLALRVVGRPRVLTKSAPTAARAITVAVGLYALVIALNYLRSRYLLGTVFPGTRRTFYDYFIALGAYLIFYALLTSRSIDWPRLMRFLYRLSLVVSTIGVGAVILRLPLSLGDLRYSTYSYQSGAVRVGFLETFGIIGVALVFTRKTRYRPIAGLIYLSALFLSGGRAAFFGTVIAVTLYLFVTQRSWQVIAIGSFVATLAIAVPSIQKNAQVNRLAQVNSGELANDKRSYLYAESLRAFTNDPLIGTGVGVHTPVSYFEPKVNAYYEAQLSVGTHATYAALLKNFGLLGFLPFTFAMLVALGRLILRVRVDPRAAFFLVFITAEAVSIFASGNGSDPTYFFALAGASAVIALPRLNGSSAKTFG